MGGKYRMRNVARGGKGKGSARSDTSRVSTVVAHITGQGGGRISMKTAKAIAQQHGVSPSAVVAELKKLGRLGD